VNKLRRVRRLGYKACVGENIKVYRISAEMSEERRLLGRGVGGWEGKWILTLCSRVVNLIKYPLMPGRFKFFECSTSKCTVTYILTL
jgi:hypothetical protein